MNRGATTNRCRAGPAGERYIQALQLSEQLADGEPNRADYQRDLSVSYNKMGDLLSDLGEGAQAKSLYEKSLLLIERLAGAVHGVVERVA